MKTMRNLCYKFIFLMLLAVTSCEAQPKSAKMVWRDFEFTEAGLKVAFPCDPVTSVKTFQEEPKLARVFSFKCSEAKFDFSVSLPERFGSFESEKVDEELQSIEQVLKTMIDDKATISVRNVVVQGFSAREFSVKNDWTLGRQLHIAHPRGGYNVQISFTPTNDKALSRVQANEFESVAKRFFDSFVILDGN